MSDSDTAIRGARNDARNDALGPWDIEHRLGYPSIQEVAPAPDGRHTVYVVREPLLRGDRSEFLSHLYLASGEDAGGDAGGAQQLTFGDHRNTSPRWSPDGRHIAFLSTRGGQANVYCLRAAGGEAWALTAEAERSVQGLAWSPDGRSLAFCLGDLPDESRQAAGRRRDDARVWGSDRRYAHLYVVPFRFGPRTPTEPRRLTAGPFHVIGFDWLPDGERIALSHRPLPEWEHWWETRLGLVATDTGGDAPAEVVDLGLTGDWSARPLASPDGRWVACHTSDREGKWALSGRVVLYPVPRAPAAGDADGRAPRPLAETPNGKCDPFGWSAAGDAVYVLEQAGMTTQLWALPADGGPGRALTDGTLLKAAPAVAGAGSAAEAIACVGQDLDAPNAVYRVSVAGGAARRVASPPLPDGWPEDAPAAEVLRWPAGDGREIEGLLVYPVGHTPGTACPLVVEVHGGPPSAFARGYVLAPDRTVDTAPLAARGYAVLRPNPRGSSGYGRDFRFANYRAWGEGDLDDVLAGVDWLVQRGVADPARLGIAGWSYGGYLTAAAIARTRRFKAACVGAGITNAISFNGTADIPDFIPDYLEAEFWDDPERYRRHSPLLRAGAISTPTLILHGEEDERVPVGQGRELHNALRRRGVPVELVLYPRQGHAIAEPRLMMDARRRIVDWMVRWV